MHEGRIKEYIKETTRSRLPILLVPKTKSEHVTDENDYLTMKFACISVFSSHVFQPDGFFVLFFSSPGIAAKTT